MRIDEILDSGEKARPEPMQEGWGFVAKAGKGIKDWGIRQIAAANKANNIHQPALDHLAKLELKLKPPTTYILKPKHHNNPPKPKPKPQPPKPKIVPIIPDKAILRLLDQRAKELKAKRLPATMFNLLKNIGKGSDKPKKVNTVGDTFIRIGAGGTSLIAVNKYLEYLDSKENNDK
jgi:hypothetical protein